MIGVSTSRSEQNSLEYLNELMPDILISSGGALVKYRDEYIYKAEFSGTETNVIFEFFFCKVNLCMHLMVAILEVNKLFPTDKIQKTCYLFDRTCSIIKSIINLNWQRR